MFQKNVSLAESTNFKIGGPAKCFFIAKTREELIKAIKEAKDLKIFILGGGNNVLALDKGYDGLVIKLELRDCKLQGSNIQAEAGVKLKDLVSLSAKESLTGLEWMAGIPGTVGGAVYGNAQAFEGKTADNIKEIEALDGLEIKTFSKEECGFSEKQSIFKKNKNLIILSAVFELEKGDKKEIEKKIKEHLIYREQNHPLKYPSAGSVFINISDKPSSYLIDKAGLKGFRIGDAQVSEKHAGFIINLGKAKSDDVLELIKKIKKKVKEKFNVDLKEEIQIIE